jgi:hypothetical protein
MAAARLLLLGPVSVDDLCPTDVPGGPSRHRSTPAISVKQHLRIKAFYGTTENAVKTQIWIAVSVYVLVAIVRKCLGLKVSL